ncbi:hypothetical protein [Corynebacterium pygosceleis]|uniref:Uncharacterized protein n=1 Tax=Corynebacterium pygosceleis TaxID=2800406 RepID=A0A9Q4GM72_9CORY|nr:hypothetical protein [Corynebacterium pygosceleis]MCK7638347.1 hypothetical protein [Corynebacterium pygosceleis]MCK7675327.1 hypothetical protein [Corynebacterium pygosceleis]MCL0121279.1 hypothetical protein [Corynebacterium pygosceleis]MCX7445495.1 hypothetical protein [Corynebacterium pygosceleis]MCX7469010.1 hypothetical protein [Corynebacterium pygosceleis]
MTRTLIQLHRTLRKRSLKAQPSQWFMIIFIWVYGVIGALSLGGMTLNEQLTGNQSALSLSLGVGVLAYWVLAFIYPSSENQLTPGWFAPLPVAARELLPGFILAAFLQSRGYLAVLNSVITFGFGTVGLVLTGHAWVVPFWLLAVVAALALSICGAEAWIVFGVLSGGRSRREKLSMAGGVVFILVIIGFNMVVNSAIGVDTARVTRILGYTPFGGAGGAAGSLADGAWATAAVQAVIGVVLLPVLWGAWHRALTRSFTQVTETGSGSRTRQRGRLMLRGVPATVGGALYSRALLYWVRDSRLLYSLISLPLFSMFFLVLGETSEDSRMEWLGAYMMAAAATQYVANAYGYDGPANWVHMAAGVPARTMVRARAAVAATVSVPTVVLYDTALGVISGFSPLWLLTTVVTVGAVPAALGFGSLLSVFNPFPTARPGTNPMKDRSGYSGAAFIAAFGGLLGIWLPLVPGIIMMVSGRGEGVASPLFLGGIAWIVVVTVVVYVVGTGVATRKLDRSWPEIFTKVRSYA